VVQPDDDDFQVVLVGPEPGDLCRGRAGVPSRLKAALAPCSNACRRIPGALAGRNADWDAMQQSPAARMRGSEVRQNSSTVIPLAQSRPAGARHFSAGADADTDHDEIRGVLDTILADDRARPARRRRQPRWLEPACCTRCGLHGVHAPPGRTRTPRRKSPDSWVRSAISSTGRVETEFLRQMAAHFAARYNRPPTMTTRRACANSRADYPRHP